MPEESGLNTQEQPFLFRGNAVAAAGYLTVLNNKPIPPNPDLITIHGESVLPFTGGVSHSKIDRPTLPYPDWISYDSCETFAEGISDGQSRVTTVRASVNNVVVTTRPSTGEAPGTLSVTFRANHLALGVRSLHSLKQEPQFDLMPPEIAEMSLTQTGINDVAMTQPVRLEFDDVLMKLNTMSALDKAFLEDEDFFNLHAPRYSASSKEPLGFSKSKMPRTPEGYILTSIVKRIFINNQAIEGNVLTHRGFGAIRFGVMLVNGYNRRTSLVQVQTGSDPSGMSCYSTVCTNGIFG